MNKFFFKLLLKLSNFFSWLAIRQSKNIVTGIALEDIKQGDIVSITSNGSVIRTKATDC